MDIWHFFILLKKFITIGDGLYMKCDCCKGIYVGHTYRLPTIGYGSAFDCLDDDDAIRFNICPDCAIKINKWIKKKSPGISLEEFWKCNIVKIKVPNQNADIYIENFEYEDLLWKMFSKFMPEKIYGEHYIFNKILDILKIY